MATWNNSPIPGSRQISPTSEPIIPDTEENVVDQSEDVIRNFMFQRYQEDRERTDEDGESTPSIPELVHFTSNPVRYLVVIVFYLYNSSLKLRIVIEQCTEWQMQLNCFTINSINFIWVVVKSVSTCINSIINSK